MQIPTKCLGGKGAWQTAVRHVEDWIVICKAICRIFISRTKVYDGYSFVEAGGVGGGGQQWEIVPPFHAIYAISILCYEAETKRVFFLIPKKNLPVSLLNWESPNKIL